MTDSHGRISDQGVEELRAWLGVERPTRGWNSAATEDAIWHFAQGVGDDNPLWWDRGYAEQAPLGRMFAPPMFLYSCSSGGTRVGEDAIHPAEAWLPGTTSIWVSDRWVFARPTWEGEQVLAVSTLSSVSEQTGRTGGREVVYVDTTAYLGGDGSPVAKCHKTFKRRDRTVAQGVVGADGDQVAQRDPYLVTYDASQLREIEDQYDREPACRRGSEPFFGDDVSVGDPLVTLVKGPMTTTNIVGFVLGWGSPMCQTNRIAHRYLEEHPAAAMTNPLTNVKDTLEGPHWDPALAQLAGMDGCYDFGAQRICWIAHALTDWCGDAGFVSEVEVRLRRPNLVGDTTWITGSVASLSRDSTRVLVNCALVATNQRAEETAVGTATVVLPLRG